MAWLLCEPWLRPQVWGGQRLAAAFGKQGDPHALIGESWELSGEATHVSRLLGHPVGESLNTLWQSRRAEWCAGRPEAKDPYFPWLIKLLDSRQPSSLQVHPTDPLARSLGLGLTGKTEAWYVLEAEPNSRFYFGWKPGITPAEIRARLAAGTIESALVSCAPRPGEAYLVPAGTVHAFSGGVVLFEVEQCSDLTLRLWDWNRLDAHGRPRTLHVEQALACIDWTRPDVPRPSSAAWVTQSVGVEQRTLLVCPYFQLEEWRITAAEWSMPMNALAAWFVAAGRVRLSAADEPQPLDCRPGQTVLLPPGPVPVVCAPTDSASATLLSVTFPPLGA